MRVDAKGTAAPTDEWRASLVRRVAAMHALWQQGVADLTTDQVNHVERPGVLPIAFTLLHFAVGEDRNVTRYVVGGGTLIWDAEGWATRVGLVGEPPVRGTPMSVAERVRLGDVDAWRAYQTAAFARTERALAALPLDRFAETAMERPPADKMKGSFLALIVPEGDPKLADVCEAYVFQHGVRHLGELEHARALVGLGGLS
jgi:hypothetical protein